MRKVVLIVPAMLALLAGCDASNDAVGLGAATGAVLGAVVADDGDELGAAVVGGAAGAVVGAAVEAREQGPMCRYTYPGGRSEVRPCQ